MKKHNKKIILPYLFAILITIFKMLFLVPAHITGGYNGDDDYIGYTIIFAINHDFRNDMTEPNWYSLILDRYIVEGIIVLLITMLIAFVVSNYLKRRVDKK